MCEPATMDTWLLLVAIFVTGVLAGPLPQTGTGNQEPISQRKVEGEDHFPNTPSNTFSSSSAIPNGAQFSRNFVPQAQHDFSGQNGGFARNLNDRGSTEVVQVVHPSLVEGLSSLEDLGLSSPNFPAGSNNNFGGFRSNGGVGFSSAESGVNNQHFVFSDVGNHPFNIQGFPPPNFGNGGFGTPAIEGHGFNRVPVHARTSGLAGQTFVPSSNNFVNGGFHNPGFGPGFNPTPFIGGHPFANSFFPFGHFNPNFPHGNFGSGGFIPHLPSQNTRVILQSVPVVVGILNETHARVTPHNQNFGNNPNFVRFNLNSERKTSEIKPSHLDEGIRANLSPETDGFGQRAHQGSLFNQKSDQNSFQSEQNNNPGGIPIGTSGSFDTAEQSFDSAPSFQNELPPVAEALIVTPNNDRIEEINREGLASVEESSKSNLIQSEGTTKLIQSDKVTGLATGTDDSTIFATSSSFASKTEFRNSFSSDFPLSAEAEGLATTREETPIEVGQNTLPVPSALASFAAVGTPPAENSHISVDTVKPFHRESPQLRTSSLAATTTPQEVAPLRPSSSVFETVNITPISTFSENNFNTPADTGSLNARLHSGISSDAELVLVPSGDNVNAHSASQGILTGGTGTSVGKLMHVGDHVSITSGNEQVKLESLIQLSTSQGKGVGASIGKMMHVGDHVSILPEISNLAPQVSPGASRVISSITDESPVGNEFPKACVTKCKCRSGTKNCATQALKITGQSPVGSSALETHEVSTPAVAITHSKFSASKPNIPFTITPSPVTDIHTPSFDALASSQQFDTISEQTVSNLDQIGSTGVSTTNLGVSGITSVNTRKFTPHAVIILPQSGSESVLPNFQQERVTPAPFTDTLHKRLGEVATDRADLAIADENIKNTQVTLTQSPVEQTTNTAVQIEDGILSSQIQAGNEIQVTSLGISSPEGQVTTQAPIIASTPLQGQETFSSFGTSTSAEQFATRTDSEVSGLDAAGVLTDPNFVLTIPLSLLSQTARSPVENANAAIGAQAARVADPSANIFNTFSFTTDPQEVLKILNGHQSSGLRSISGFSQTFGLNSDTSGTISQQPQVATTQQEPQAPGQSEISAASPSGSLSFLPETLENDSGASGHGVPLIQKTFQIPSGIQDAEASNDKISQNQAKLGNNLKRELPLVS
ncbi:serine-rich adhesin for platelets-like isoform X2 [Macrobrachium rosenbergii]|uniref:serine-rich adhesin for platelets-like isoform X2 n=1 Tax=Macrobrachium rosenbergii TaxID=79674 RepID=UPI0034D40650